MERFTHLRGDNSRNSGGDRRRSASGSGFRGGKPSSSNRGYKRDFDSKNNERADQRESRPARFDDKKRYSNTPKPAFGSGFARSARGNDGSYPKPNRRNFEDNKSSYGSGFAPPKPKKIKIDKSRPSKDFVDMSKPMRLNKFIANSNICSRREADEFIQTGVVSVNGQIVTELGIKIIPATDKVHFHDQLIGIEKKIYILINKPKNVITTSDDPDERKTVLDLVKDACSERIYPVGRLDRNTTGVLLLTNDGDLTLKLTHPKYEKKKIYHVKLDKDFSATDMEKLRAGIILEDGDIKADDISYVKEEDKKQIGIEIHSGKNRIVRRMFEHLGYKIVSLDRVYFAGLTKKNLPRGRWRFLSEVEINLLKMNAS